MANKKDLLTTYKEKRKFNVTPEPAGKVNKSGAKRIFVIQEHSARALHYDFRIEDEGVLKSWAIPKGPSVDPADHHLAVMTEDHPIEYADFEGTIPEGEYGAGNVIVWDQGTYSNLKDKTIHQCIEDGALAIWLNGKKLKGGFALIKTKYKGARNSWIFLKMKDEYAKPGISIIDKLPKSIFSHKKLKMRVPKSKRKA